MKLFHERNGIDLEFSEDRITVLSIENPDLYCDFVSGLWNQSNGIESGFILSSQGSAIDIGKKAEILLSPLMVSVNSKKVLTKLYQEMGQVSGDYCFEEVAKINQGIIAYLDTISQHIPYPIEFALDVKAGDLFKLYNVCIDESGSLLERILSYIRTLHRICGVSVFFLMNLKQFICQRDLEGLYRTLIYENVCILLIEGSFQGDYEYEKNYIIDKDRCIINLSD